MHHATGNIFPEPLQYFRAHRAGSGVFALSPFLHLVCVCICVYIPVLTWGYATKPHVVMLSKACDISCHAWRTLQRHASRAPRSSPLAYIYLPEMSRNKRQKPREVFRRVAPKRRPFGPICVTLTCCRLLLFSCGKVRNVRHLVHKSLKGFEKYNHISDTSISMTKKEIINRARFNILKNIN